MPNKIGPRVWIPLAFALALSACNLPTTAAVSEVDQPPTSEPTVPPEATAEIAAPQPTDTLPPEPTSEFSVVDYGPSSTTAEYGPGCTASQVAFEISVMGVDQVQDAWLEYQYSSTNADPAMIGPEASVPLESIGESAEFPGAHELGVVVDIGQSGAQQLDGADGLLAWNLYLQLGEGEVFEYPQGGPPVVAVEYCELTVSAPPTPTLALITIPADLIHSLGSDQVMTEEQFFDLDEGVLTDQQTQAADFQLHPGSDPYLDDFLPLSGRYVGYFGFDKPSKADCVGTLKAAAGMTLNWPNWEDVYLCYETDQGRQGWFKLNVWVSQPLPERRLEFDWATFE